MGLTDWARKHLLATIALSLVFGTLTAVSLLGVAAWALWALLGLGGASTLGTLLPLFLFGLVVGVPATAVALIAAAVGLATRASSAVSDRTEFAGVRLGQVASYVERESEIARLVGLSDLVEHFDSRSPDRRADDRIQRLKDRYVSGDISEFEFEERMQRVMDEEGVHRDRVSAIDDELGGLDDDQRIAERN
ncbi:SHOCT domain-containing protein [Halosimplex aquaticum]|uniref:SHOCT domain-containing protein n=1 Tax=Halosimplex aquaticum TaxID=3026162 RepID=A0ABD5Y0Q9_9EURY|nr:SHOCT domain-containing protein [Halosimplex aquaticum]